MKFKFLTFITLFALLDPATASESFQVRGIGGGGGFFVPSISPYNSNFMLVSSDMGGTYRSTDGGNNWELINFKELSDTARGTFPAFFKDRVFWHSGSDLRVSKDMGKSWARVRSQPWGDNGKLRYLAALPGAVDILLVGTSNGLWRTTDAGINWERVIDDWTVEPIALGDRVYTFSGRNTFQVSLDRGHSWTPRSFPWMEDNTVFSLAGGTDGNESILLASVWKIGIIRSRDGGSNWEVVVDTFEDQNNLQMAGNQTKVIYAFQNHGEEWCKTVWRSEDSGDNWRKVFRMTRWPGNVTASWVQTELKWGFYITKNGFFASRADPRLALLATQGDFYITRDGANSWQPIINRPAGASAPLSHQSIGLEVTSCWKYLIDPFKKNRHFIAYTDIGLARSEDGGSSWQYSAKGSPWSNTFYDVVFDPKQPGRMYAAASSRHDIPHWTHIDAGKEEYNRGGVVVSDDGGESWRPLGSGLPDKPATSVLLIPGPSPDSNSLFVTLYGEGVFKSIDGGATWRKSSKGLGHPGNLHALRIRQHPKSGNLYCMVTAWRNGNSFTIPGGLWRSTDGGANWTDITADDPFFWPTEFALDTANEQQIYLAASTAPGKSQGGVWVTRDGGRHWLRLMNDSELNVLAGGANYDHVMTVAIEPHDPRIIYAGTTLHGLWYSTDSGKRWQHYADFPHRAAQSIYFNPDNSSELIVTTFGGGAWQGPRIRRSSPNYQQ